jgi:hypothetical protein
MFFGSSDEQPERALLARKAKAVGRKALLELDTIVSPDTLSVANSYLGWNRGVKQTATMLVPGISVKSSTGG